MKKNLYSTILLLFISGITFSQSLSLPYYTGFDNPNDLAGWQEFRTGFISMYSWGSSTGGGFTGGCIGHDYNVGGNQNDTVIDWFVSPPLNFTAASIIAMKVNTSGFSTPFPDNCEVYFGTGNQDPSIGNFVLIGNVSYMLPQFTWLDTTFNISNISDSGYIAFKYKTIGAAWSTYSIDNVSISLDSTVGIGENLIENAFEIYPNPLKNSTTIFLNEKLLNTHLEIRMIDVSGREVKRINDVSNKAVQINRENISDGIYFIRLFQNDKMVACKKIIIE